MSWFEALLSRWLRGAIDASVERALAEHATDEMPDFDFDELLFHYLVHGDRSRLHIHETAVVNNALFNLESGDITVSEFAFFGHNVSVLTGTHDFRRFDKERQDSIPRTGRDIVIGRGAWLASDVLVLGPCIIGKHAVVGAGSLVTHDVEPYTIVSGRPARMIRRIEHDSE
ncbi:MAG TPA: acyltransferase [Actinomycetota bacterium]|nr:acyltransferase [Actinomycetota bacterium]